MYHPKSNKQKNLKKKFFLGLLKLEGQRRKLQDSEPDPLVRGADPDPNQNVTDSQHWYEYLYDTLRQVMTGQYQHWKFNIKIAGKGVIQKYRHSNRSLKADIRSIGGFSVQAYFFLTLHVAGPKLSADC